jgi:hypothetical protein
VHTKKERIDGYSETGSPANNEDDAADHAHRFAEEVPHEEPHEEPVHTAWKFGTALLGGFLLPILLGVIFPPPDISECEVCRQRTEDASRISPDNNTGMNNNNTGVKELPVDESTTGSDGKGGRAKTMDLACDSGECQHYHHDNTQVLKENETKPQ